MPDHTQFDPDRIRVVLDHGEVVELDGGTLVLDGEESPSVVLWLAPWRARSVARVLQEWSSASGIHVELLITGFRGVGTEKGVPDLGQCGLSRSA